MAPCTVAVLLGAVVVLAVLLSAIVVPATHPRRTRTCTVDKGTC
jgi:hypothetical protein